MRHSKVIGRSRAIHPLAIGLCLLLCAGGCGKDGRQGKKKATDGADEHVTTLGSFEITGRLVEIPGLEKHNGKFPPNDLGYDYAYIVKYEIEAVHRGEIEAKTILVGHYNPLKPRNKVADARCKDVGGNVKRIRQGDVHRLALEVPIDDYCMAGMYNEYLNTPDGQQPIYWAVWTNRVGR